MKTVDLREVRKFGAVAGQYATWWAAQNGQSGLWMGVGATPEASEADARREIEEHGEADPESADLETYLVEGDEDCVVVRADDENNAEAFWDALRERFPVVAEKLQERDVVRITGQEWSQIRALPGFADGPMYARTALLKVEGDANA